MEKKHKVGILIFDKVFKTRLEEIVSADPEALKRV